MDVLDRQQLIERLTAGEADLHELGWGTPDYLFGLAPDGGLELWMEMPGGAEAFLAALADLGVSARPTVVGLVIVTSTGYTDTSEVMGLPALGELRHACEDAGIAPESLVDRLPAPRPRPASRRRQRAVFCVLRTGDTFAVVREMHQEARVEPTLPKDLGSQQQLRRQALRVLGERA